MSNDRINDAELEVLLSGDQRKVDRLMLIGIRELGDGLGEVKIEIAAMRSVCEERGKLCPGMHACIADPVQAQSTARTLAAETAETARVLASETAHTAQALTDSRQTWAMWGVSMTLLRDVALPLAIVIATLLVAGKL